ncbi:MAG: septal ring lytic transglycosylase RlpA family protein [Ignavibacteria bacterium]|nr:septal ring lytic transglycosylase RlpA family protein [Ignavibacteria bacterium]
MRRKFNFSFLILFSISTEIFSQKLYETEGFASYYSEDFHGKPTSSGEIYDMHKLTCAHPYLPFNTWLKVTNLANQKSVIVRVNDRGPFMKNRIIDLSYAAARELGMLGPGSIYVKLEIVSPPLTQPETNIGRVPSETPIPELEESDVSLRFRTKPYQPEKSANISEFGLYDINLKKIDISSGYLIQLSSFSTLKNAQIFLDQIHEVNEQELFIYHPSPGIYRVVVGIFSNMREAQIKKEEIAKHYPQCFVITYK